jgi:transcriptional regulator with XRE-family HTH domain
VTVLDVVRKAIAFDIRSVSQIARDSGVSQSQLSRLMNGERDIAVFTLEKLAPSLGMCLRIEPVTEGIPLDLLVLDPTELE